MPPGGASVELLDPDLLDILHHMHHGQPRPGVLGELHRAPDGRFRPIRQVRGDENGFQHEAPQTKGRPNRIW